MIDPYLDREQTRAKHFILKHYLQALAFKVLTFSDVAYVDGFSGPWEAKTDDFADTSFMIAISVLQDAQRQFHNRQSARRKIRCFFSESNPTAFEKLNSAVATYHQPDLGFEVRTFPGKFENAVSEIRSFVGSALPLIFIDPTGWTGYPLEKIRPLFDRPKSEVLINFMYDFINRFAASEEAEIVNSFAPILGGSDWPDRLERDLPRGLAVEKLFREQLKASLNLKYVVSTKIDKATADRPHFFLTYGTQSIDGLITFRQTEYDALRQHAKSKAAAIESRREKRTKTSDMFVAHEAEVREASVDEIVAEHQFDAAKRLLDILSLTPAPMKFLTVVSELLQAHMLRKTNVKDICVQLAKAGKIENTWGGGNRKPQDQDLIVLK